LQGAPVDVLYDDFRFGAVAAVEVIDGLVEVAIMEALVLVVQVVQVVQVLLPHLM